MSPLTKRIGRLLLLVAFLAITVIAFIGYLQPAFIVDLANRIILCF